MSQMIGVDGRPLMVQGYGAIWGSAERGERMGRRGFVTEGGEIVLSLNHAADRGRLANTRSGALRVWQDGVGLAFEADVAADENGLWLLRYIATHGRCSYLGQETYRECDDGVREITSVVLQEISLTATPFFSATGAWRSDTDWHDMPPDVRHLFFQFDRGAREALPDLLKASARQRPPAVAPAAARALAHGTAPGKTPGRRTAGGMTRTEWRALMGNQQLADALWDLQETSRHASRQRYL
jgi:Caudovirus prohead serine protease